MAPDQNQDTAAAWRFHNATKYIGPTGLRDYADAEILMGEPPHLVQAMGEQDPAIEPLPTKSTPRSRRSHCHETSPHRISPRSMRSRPPASSSASAVPDLNMVARLCLRSNGLLKRWRSPSGREIEFRAAGCTGARYHLELYLVCGELPGLEAGVYQYAAHDHSLPAARRRLPGGRRRGDRARAGNAAAPVIAVWTSTFWRNAWRYQARAYRHVYWDTGTALANLLAVAADARLPARVVLGFADAEINALLDVDGEREAAVSLVLGRSADPPPESPEIRPLALPTMPLATGDRLSGNWRDAHRLVACLRRRGPRLASRCVRPVPAAARQRIDPLQPLDAAALPTDPIDAVIERRRSNRHYAAETPISFAALSTILTASLREPRWTAWFRAHYRSLPPTSSSTTSPD